MKNVLGNALAALLVFLMMMVLIISGCDGSGGMGGQGLVINVHQNATPDVATPGSGTNASTITVTIDDGGTLENPSVEVPATAVEPETQPKTPETQPEQ